MKRLFKWLLGSALVAVVLVVAAYLSKDAILRVVAEKRLHSATGMETHIGKFSSGRIGPATYVTLENLKLYNTAEFGGGLFLDIPELHLEFDPAALAERRLHIRLARLNLAELDIVKNAAGQTNVFAIQSLLGGGTTNGTTNGATSSAAVELGGIEFQGIDVLTLSLGRAKYLDLGNPNNNREIHVDLQRQIFNNVKAEADLYGILFIIWLRSGGAISVAPGSQTAIGWKCSASNNAFSMIPAAVGSAVASFSVCSFSRSSVGCVLPASSF